MHKGSIAKDWVMPGWQHYVLQRWHSACKGFWSLWKKMKDCSFKKKKKMYLGLKKKCTWQCVLLVCISIEMLSNMDLSIFNVYIVSVNIYIISHAIYLLTMQHEVWWIQVGHLFWNSSDIFAKMGIQKELWHYTQFV